MNRVAAIALVLLAGCASLPSQRSSHRARRRAVRINALVLRGAPVDRSQPVR